MKEIINIISGLKVPKAQRNTFGSYNYRSCEDILEAVKPLLLEQDCVLNLCDEVVCVGSRYYIKAMATLTNATGERISSTAFAREEETKKGMDGSQITGTASSYARKYALNGLFCIDDTRDADTDERARENAARANKDKEQPATASTIPDPIENAMPAPPASKKPLLMTHLANDAQCLRVMQGVYNASLQAKDPAKFNPSQWLCEHSSVAADVLVIFKEKYELFLLEKQKK
ncbi:MAG: ERF family protein [Alistipes sp.]